MCFIVIVLCIVLILHFHSYLDFFKTNIENLLYGIYTFLLVWMLFSLILLLVSYRKINQYFDYESISKDIVKLNDLKRFYERLHTNNSSIPSKIKEQLQFQLMRQSFINPIELPILTECFLRRDFDFSMYLGFCVSDFLSEIFSFISIEVYSFILVLLGIWKGINYFEMEVATVFVYVIPVV
jgi:hypothetical protein